MCLQILTLLDIISNYVTGILLIKVFDDTLQLLLIYQRYFWYPTKHFLFQTTLLYMFYYQA